MSSPDGNSRSDFIPEPSGSSLTYGRGGGCFVTRKQSALAGVAILGAIVLAAAFGRYVWAPADPATAVSLASRAASCQDGLNKTIKMDPRKNSWYSCCAGCLYR